MSTWNETAGDQLQSLCRALGYAFATQPYRELLAELFAPWGEAEVPDRPPYATLPSDDHSPYEFSVALGPQGAELRLLFEPQGLTPSLEASHEAALALHARLAARRGVDFARFEAIRELFCPPTPQAPFSIWHAVSLSPGKPPAFKIYLNPWARGRERARATVTEALDRLGLADAARALVDNLDAHGRGRDEFNYFSLDLSDDPAARVKVYSVHPDATADDIERSFALAPSHQAGDVSDFCARVIGTTGPFTRKPLTSCFSFVGGGATPSAATVHVPAAPYVPDAAVLAARQLQFLDRTPAQADALRRVLEVMARPATPGGHAAQSYASLRRERGVLRLTAYFTPGAFAAQALALPDGFRAVVNG